MKNIQVHKIPTTMVRIEIVRTETIKPSSPTPDHLKKFGLSVFDQYIPGDHTPIVLFYPGSGQNSVSDRIRRLKLSLSEALAQFYPLAGRIAKDELYVECSDAGVDFVEAEVEGCCLSDILRRPVHKIIGMLVPCGPVERWDYPLMRVQANVFGCGGMGIGLRFGHIIMDASAMGAFLKGWAAVVRGDANASVTDLDAVASRFPAIPRTIPPIKPREMVECSTRRFVFHPAKIAALRDKASSAGGERPTRVAVVSAFIWKCIVNALTKKSGHETKPIIVSQPMNLRGRLEPPLSGNSLGNMVLPTFAEYGDLNELQRLAGQLRQGLRDVIHNYVPKLQDSEAAWTIFIEQVKKFVTLSTKGDINFYILTSWCRYGWYELDFGWGRPAWISPVNPDMKNVVVMMDERDGDGIEVLVTLPEQDMIFFETDHELLEFGSLNPSAGP